MPSSDAQEALISSVYNDISLDPLETGYIESHGRGTAVGDLIEAAALGAVFGSRPATSQPFYVGSLKSNVGHLEGASGVISIIKRPLCLRDDSSCLTATLTSSIQTSLSRNRT